MYFYKGVEVLLSILISICNSSSKKPGAGGTWVWGQPVGHSKFQASQVRLFKKSQVRLFKKKRKKSIIINWLSEMFCCSHNLLSCYLWLVFSLYTITIWAHILSSISPKLQWSFWKESFIHLKRRLIVIAAHCIPIESRTVLDTVGMLVKKKSILKSWWACLHYQEE